jgi:hypothetical protein
MNARRPRCAAPGARRPSHRAIRSALILAIGLASACDRDDLLEGPNKRKIDSGGGPVDENDPKAMKINEVVLVNVESLADESGKFPAWIELYNTSDKTVDLSGVFLSNSLIDPEVWAFPSIPETKVPPKGYIVVFADGDVDNADDLHASFVIAPGFLQLAYNKGSHVATFNAANAAPDMAIGLTPDGLGTFTYLEEATPGAVNSAAGDPPDPPDPTEGDFVRGDATEDGRVNIADMNEILKILNGQASRPRCEDRVDANDDGAANITDVIYLGNFLFRRGPRIPAPFPGEGTDPTSDLLPCPF